MDQNLQNLTQQISGAAMDRVSKPRKQVKWRVIGAAIVLMVVLLGYYVRPQGMSVLLGDISLSAVEAGVFRDELPLRASIEASRTVLLDVADGGRVERVFVTDGAEVRRGEFLFKLHNPTLQQQMLARESDVAQQTSNLGTLKASLQATKAEYRRAIAQLQFDLKRAEVELTRSNQLATQGFISSAALEDVARRVELQSQLLADAREASATEIQIKESAVQRLDASMARLQSGLSIVRQSVQALDVKASLDGKLTGFSLKEGAILKLGDSIGRIDVQGHYKLVAAIDEFYLGKLSVGVKGIAVVDAHEHPILVEKINPQVVDGRFFAELKFLVDVPQALSSGQTIVVRLVLAAPRQALTIADGDFYQDTGGSWAFVLNDSGHGADRRSIRLGKRARGRIEVLDGLQSGDRVVTSSYRDYNEVRKLKIRD
jgi:HlyD family secretion protein